MKKLLAILITFSAILNTQAFELGLINVTKNNYTQYNKKFYTSKIETKSICWDAQLQPEKPTPEMAEAGKLLKKAGSQLLTGTIAPSIGLTAATLFAITGAVMINGDNMLGIPLIVLSPMVAIGGFVTSFVTKIAGASNIRKAGKILNGEIMNY